MASQLFEGYQVYPTGDADAVMNDRGITPADILKALHELQVFSFQYNGGLKVYCEAKQKDRLVKILRIEE